MIATRQNSPIRNPLKMARGGSHRQISGCDGFRIPISRFVLPRENTVQRVQRLVPMVLLFQSGLDSADSGAFRPHRPSGGNQSLFRFIGHKGAIVADAEAKRDFPTEVSVALPLIPLHLRRTRSSRH